MFFSNNILFMVNFSVLHKMYVWNIHFDIIILSFLSYLIEIIEKKWFHSFYCNLPSIYLHISFIWKGDFTLISPASVFLASKTNLDSFVSWAHRGVSSKLLSLQPSSNSPNAFVSPDIYELWSRPKWAVVHCIVNGSWYGDFKWGLRSHRANTVGL